ncbi:glycosyl transferase [bacterium]|nr:glycosyl transferase [bacterium]
MSVKKKLANIFRCGLTLISPKLNTMACYKAKFNKKLDLNNPQTLNEKNLWLKFNTYWNNPLVKQCADKYLVREYVEKAGCPEILNQLEASFKNPEDLAFDELPDKFALKLNIGCGYNYIVSDKTKENRSDLVKHMQKWMKKAKTCYLGYSEMQYKGVEPRFLVEHFLGDENGNLPEDYKFYCLNGKCEMIMFCKDRHADGHGAKYFFMDTDWNMLANVFNDPNIIVEKPENFKKAIQYAEMLSKPFPYVRVDLYIVGSSIYFGELTFTPAAGMDVDHKLKVFGTDEDLDHIYGRKLKLPKK